MLRYYDERASEYEEAYAVGTGTASIPDPQIFRTDAAILAGRPIGKDAGGRFLIRDSAWSSERAKHNTKVECQPRQLNDGTAFEIYKRYCDRDDISRWAREYGVSLRIEHFGPAFCAVSGAFD